MQNKMTSKERFYAAIDSQELDCIPICAPFQGNWSLENNNVSLKDSIDIPQLSANAQIDTIKKCEFDGLDVLWDWMTIIEVLGGEVSLVGTSHPKTLSNVIKDEKAFEIMPLPEPENDYRIKSAKKTAEILIESLSKEKYLYAGLVAPLTLAAELRGLEYLLRDTYKNKTFANNVLQFSTESIKNYIEFLKPLKVDAFCVCDPTSSAGLISKKHFREFGMPYLKEIAKKVKETDKQLIIHICGDVSDRLEGIAAIEPDIISLEHEVDLEYAKSVLKNNITILGNLDVATSLFLGNPQTVKEEIETCISKTGGVGHILAGGCDLAPGTPEENITIWKDVVTNYGEMKSR